MKRTLLFITCVLASLTMLAEEYYPEGTKWTEIRLDTLKYNSWYSKVGNEWVPNFETIEYYVKGEYTDNHGGKYKCVYTNGPEWTDSLSLLLQEEGDAEYVEPNSVMVSVLAQDYGPLWPGEAYQFYWNIGQGLYFEDITMSNTTSIGRSRFYYGIIGEIKERHFGGIRPLKYVELEGQAPANNPNSPIHNVNTKGGRILQGIGITEWNDGECLFGPPNPYYALGGEYQSRHYRSMLVHFERDGEVLYDVWPDTKPLAAYRPMIEEGKVWTVREIADYPPFDQFIVNYYFDGDTIVDGRTCKRMMSVINANEENWSDGVFTPGNLPKYYNGAFYEQDKKVYYVSNGYQKLSLLYDFTLSTNDTIDFEGYLFTVKKMSGGITGFKGTYYDLSWYDNTVIERWLEGVGSNVVPYVSHPSLCGGVGGGLLSCRVGNEVIYYNGGMDDPYIMGAQKHRFDFTHTTKQRPTAPMRRAAEQTLYGEYNDFQLGINLEPIDDAYLVRIINESGIVVYEKAINAGNIVGLNIDISTYPEGRYTVTVENSDEIFTGDFETLTTGIEEVGGKRPDVRDQIYNLQGQRLSSLQKGLNIVNGYKVYVK